MKHILRAQLFCVFFTFIGIPSFAQVLINEYSASNLNQFFDNYGNDEDWIELYNTGSVAVSLTGYYLSDDTADITKWQVPAGATIAAHGYFRFWASGRNEVSGGNYHTNFGLNQTKTKKEYVVFTSSAGILIDSIQLKTTTQVGHSVGRTPDGGSTWAVYTTPTINASNNTSTPYTRYAYKPAASIDAGFYPSSVTVTLSTTEPSSAIRYTLDGTEPTASSTLYAAPIIIPGTSVLKAVTFSTNSTILRSFTLYDTYFIGVTHTIPVVSISGTQLDNLANGNSVLVPVGSFEYFDTNGVRKAKTYGDYNKHGQDSWVNSQRSIDFVARDQMGYNKYIKEKLFATTPRKEFQNLILRAAGDDNYPADHHAANAGSAHVRDAFVHSLADIGGLSLNVRRFAKCIVYINAQYWGVYDLRENPDRDDYCEYYYGQDKYHLYYLMYWGGRWAQYGGTAAYNDWDNLHSYIISNDMSIPANYQYVTDRLDVSSLVDYVLVNMFSVCSDWLNWNVGWWRGTNTNGGHQKWGYILWDNDATFGHYINYTGIPNTTPNALPCDPEALAYPSPSDPEGVIDELNHLRQNPDFEHYYLSRMIDLWNTVFSCDNMLQELDREVAIIDPEMNQHALRWGGTYTEWHDNVQQLRDFIIARCDSLTNGFMDCYPLTGPYNLVVNTDLPAAGPIKVNTVIISQFPWSANYYGGLGMEMKVLLNNGYIFDHWSSGFHSLSPSASSDSVTFMPGANDTITAHMHSAGTAEYKKQDFSLTVFPSLVSEKFTIVYNLPSLMQVTIKLQSLEGKDINQLMFSQEMVKGRHLNTFDLSGSELAPGMYIILFEANGNRSCKKLIYAPQ